MTVFGMRAMEREEARAADVHRPGIYCSNLDVAAVAAARHRTMRRADGGNVQTELAGKHPVRPAVEWRPDEVCDRARLDACCVPRGLRILARLEAHPRPAVA